jgi:hypothetical protein
MSHKGLWKRVRDRSVVAGLTVIILGLVSAQLFDVAGMAAAFGQDGSADALDLQATKGIVAPVLQADLGGGGLDEAAPRTLKASIWLAPIASLRGGFGMGWLEAGGPDQGFLNPFAERRELRLRLGGGLMAPLTPSMGLDLHAGA